MTSNGKFVAYYRVSTERQGRSGLGLDAQRSAVTNYLNGGNWSIVSEFTEVESGRKSDRPALDKALAAARLHRCPLVVSKVDRLTRSVAFLSRRRTWMCASPTYRRSKAPRGVSCCSKWWPSPS